jgi:hypothetical protein
VSEPTGSTRPAPRKLTPAERRRRRARRAWIPTGIIAGLIIAAIIVAVGYHAQGGGKPIVLKAGDTHFTAAGVAALEADLDAQIDVRGVRSAAAIDLPANGTRKYGPNNGTPIELDLVGKGGIQSLYVDYFRVTTKDGYLISVSTTSREFDFADIDTQLHAESVVGITNAQLGAFLNARPVGAGDAHSFFSLPVGTGTALGVPTRVSVTCSGPKGCEVNTVTTLEAN